MGAGCQSFNQVPVIVAEIGAQSVDIQDQSHGAAQQFSKHFSVSHTRGEIIMIKNKTGKKKIIKKTKMRSETERSSESRISTPSQSPSLSGCLCENKSISPSIILAEVHKVDNPWVAFFLTHVGSEVESCVSCWELEL